MDNRQKLDFILKLERRRKIRNILWTVAIIALVGAGIVYMQARNMTG